MIKVVDCTLRDGGHVNKSKFGERTIYKIIENLISSNVDIIEIGFLKNQTFDCDTAVFSCVKEAKKFIKPNANVEYALMAQEDQYDVSKLEKCDGLIEHIRVSFHNYDLNEGIEFASKVISKGYKCHVNPINLQGYSDRELIEIISKINELNPYTFTIVDTFGAMTEDDLNRIVSIVNHNLNPDINIGLHLHENLGLSFSLAQFFTRIKPPKRNVSIDASLNGIGRPPGNLSIELFMDYMNRIFNKNYNINPIYDAIDDFIMPIKKKTQWGYSLPYALSAQYRLHRTYAEYLLSKAKLKTKDIQKILSNVAQDEKAVYNQKYIQDLYIEYLCNEIDDFKYLSKLSNELASSNKLLFLAPGKSLALNKEKILNFIKYENPTVIAANFSLKSLGIKSDYIFFSSILRYEQSYLSDEKIIITSNLANDGINADYILNFKSLVYSSDDIKIDNALILLLNMLNRLNIKKDIFIAGFDGFKKGNNYFDDNFTPLYENMSNKNDENEKIRNIISKDFSNINIISLTESQYIKEKELV